MNISSVGSSSLMQQMQQAMFSKADANGDGQLSSDEFLSIGQDLQGGGKSGPAKAMRGSGGFAANFGSEMMGSMLSMQEAPSAEDIFTGADADADGKLTAEELAADMAAHAPPGMDGVDHSEMAANILADADSDGDGSLTLEEFEAARPSGPPPGGPRFSIGSDTGSTEEASSDASAEETTYDAADTNQDGVVSMSELLASLQSAEDKASGFSTEVSDLLQQLLDKLTSETSSTVEAAA